MLNVTPIKAFSDNYIWLIHLGSSKQVVIVDPGDAQVVLDALSLSKLTPAAILITHHHQDHIDGISAIVQQFKDIPVYGPKTKAIVDITHPVSSGSVIDLGQGINTRVIAVPGHTTDHIAYYINDALFCGDTLFGGGCGRLFEGSPAQMYTSLNSLAQLPDDTKVYCSHEYTSDNLTFARMVEPNNAALQRRSEQVATLRNNNEPTLPSTIGLEKATNPFLRTGIDEVYQAACTYSGKQLANGTAVFAMLRYWKDTL